MSALHQRVRVANYEFHFADAELQHRRLHKLVIEFTDALGVRAPSRVLRDCFGRLVEYTHLHFADEEQFMLEHDYPAAGLLSHRRAHAAFLDRLRSIQHEIGEGYYPTRAQFEASLEKWFGEHLDVEDSDYVDYFRTSEG